MRVSLMTSQVIFEQLLMSLMTSQVNNEPTTPKNQTQPHTHTHPTSTVNEFNNFSGRTAPVNEFNDFSGRTDTN